MINISRMTTFNPGHNPPQVTIHALTYEGLKCKNFLGPASNHCLDYANYLSLSKTFFYSTYDPL